MSTALRRQLREAVETTLRENGVTAWSSSKTGKHIKYRFAVDGWEKSFTVAATPSDQRCVPNAICQLRKVIGTKRVVRKNPENRACPKRKAKPPLPKMPMVSERPDPWEKLKEMKVVEPVPSHGEPTIWRRLANWLHAMASS